MTPIPSSEPKDVMALRLAAAFAELEGREAASDLVQRVLERHREARELDPTLHAQERFDPRGSRGRRWTFAAALLGIAVVVALWWLQERADEDELAPRDEDWVRVHSVEDLAALPASTRAIEASGFDDADVPALLRFQGLRALKLRTPEACVSGLGLKTAHPPRPKSVGDASFATLVALRELRVLRFEGTYRVTGRELARLAELPRLVELALSFLDVEDAELLPLASLPSLRRLDLSFNHGFAGEGLAAIVACRRLRALNLRGCQQLHGGALAVLAELTLLEELDLGAIDGTSWRSDLIEKDERAQRIFAHAQRLADRLGMGPTDQALEAIGRLTRLRALNLDGAHCTTAGIAALATCDELRELSLFGCSQLDDGLAALLPARLESLTVCGEFTDRFCEVVAERLRELSTLGIPACYRITDDGVMALSGLPRLAALELRQCRGLSSACLEGLARAKTLRNVDLRHCDFVDAGFVAALRARCPALVEIRSSLESR